MGAVKDFNKAITLKPKYADAYSNRGVSKHHLGDYMGAIKDFTKAIKLNPKDAAAYNNRGVDEAKLGDKKGSIKDLAKAKELGYSKADETINTIGGINDRN